MDATGAGAFLEFLARVEPAGFGDLLSPSRTWRILGVPNGEGAKRRLGLPSALRSVGFPEVVRSILSAEVFPRL